MGNTSTAENLAHVIHSRAMSVCVSGLLVHWDELVGDLLLDLLAVLANHREPGASLIHCDVSGASTAVSGDVRELLHDESGDRVVLVQAPVFAGATCFVEKFVSGSAFRGSDEAFRVAGLLDHGDRLEVREVFVGPGACSVFRGVVVRRGHLGGSTRRITVWRIAWRCLGGAFLGKRLLMSRDDRHVGVRLDEGLLFSRRRSGSSFIIVRLGAAGSVRELLQIVLIRGPELDAVSGAALLLGDEDRTVGAGDPQVLVVRVVAAVVRSNDRGDHVPGRDALTAAVLRLSPVGDLLARLEVLAMRAWSSQDRASKSFARVPLDAYSLRVGAGLNPSSQLLARVDAAVRGEGPFDREQGRESGTLGFLPKVH